MVYGCQIAPAKSALLLICMSPTPLTSSVALRLSVTVFPARIICVVRATFMNCRCAITAVPAMLTLPVGAVTSRIISS